MAAVVLVASKWEFGGNRASAGGTLKHSMRVTLTLLCRLQWLVFQVNPIPSNPIQSNPIQSNPNVPYNNLLGWYDGDIDTTLRIMLGMGDSP